MSIPILQRATNSTKKGRTITGFSFKFKQKKPKQAEIAIETIQAPQNTSDTIKPSQSHRSQNTA